MHAARKVVVANAVLAAAAVFILIAYAKLSGLAIDEHFMGFQRDWRWPRAPAWTTPLMMEAAFLIALCFRKFIDQRKLRVMVGGLSAFGLLFLLVLPVLLEQVYGTEFYSPDQLVSWYACFSNIAYALVGSSTSAA